MTKPRWWYEINTTTTRVKIQRHIKKLLGICIWCSNDAKKPYSLCEPCLTKCNDQQRKFKRDNRQKWKEEGRCICCHKKLHEWFDKDRSSCWTCADRKNNHVKGV